MITAEDYILYGLLAFIALLLVSIVVAMFRQSHDIGELRGQNEGIQRQLAELSGRIDGLTGRIDGLTGHSGELTGQLSGLSGRMERLERIVAAQTAELGEIKGLLLALNRQMGLLLRHRHDGITGQVILIPEEAAVGD